MNNKTGNPLENNLLEIKNLSKRYGRVHALSGLDLTIERGQVFGLLGPNGSGKTTTLGIILGATLADSGTFSWFGEPFSQYSCKRIGAILEQPSFYPYLDAENNLRIVARIRNVSENEIGRVLNLTGLSDRKKHRFQTYSFGMKQRLAIASAMLGNPEVLILDEPTNGLDPAGIAEMRDLITRIARTGATIILASHLLDEVQKVCTHAAVLQKGRKLFSGNVEEVLNDGETILLSADNMELLAETILSYPAYASHTVTDKYIELRLNGNCLPGSVNEFLYGQGITLTHLSVRKKSLENYFLELTGNSGSTHSSQNGL